MTVHIYEGVSRTGLKYTGLQTLISAWKNEFKGHFYCGEDDKRSSSQVFEMTFILFFCFLF